MPSYSYLKIFKKLLLWLIYLISRVTARDKQRIFLCQFPMSLSHQLLPPMGCAGGMLELGARAKISTQALLHGWHAP